MIKFHCVLVLLTLFVTVCFVFFQVNQSSVIWLLVHLVESNFGQDSPVGVPKKCLGPLINSQLPTFFERSPFTVHEQIFSQQAGLFSNRRP
jgi:hypothetical protein